MNALGRGKDETTLLRNNINDQLNRLFTQLEDLEELKDELEVGEYEEEKKETLDQLKEFQVFLEKSLSGDMSLVDEFGTAQLAIQAAVSEAFKTPEVIRMFANAEPDQLRKKLETLKRDVKLKVISEESFNNQAAEVLIALKKMKAELTLDEQEFLKKMSTAVMLETAMENNNVASGMQENLMTVAKDQINRAEGK